MATTIQCSNCCSTFNGGYDYTRHLASCNGNPNQCPVCRAWFPRQGERDKHVVLNHVGIRA